MSPDRSRLQNFIAYDSCGSKSAQRHREPIGRGVALSRSGEVQRSGVVGPVNKERAYGDTCVSLVHQ